MADGSPLRGLPALILENINKCDVDVRKDLFGGMLLAGGGSLFGSLRERLEADLHDAAAGLHSLPGVRLLTRTHTGCHQLHVFWLPLPGVRLAYMEHTVNHQLNRVFIAK
jgi:actin-related protein